MNHHAESIGSRADFELAAEVPSLHQFLGQVICQAKFLDKAQLGLEVIDVAFFVMQIRK